MIERFDSLGHNAVIGCNNQYDDIGNLGSARTHHRKGFVTGRIKEGNISLGSRHHIGADMLRNTAEFMGSNISAANSVQRLGLTVVNMSHNSNNRRTCQQLGIFITNGFDNGLIIEADDFYIAFVFRSKDGRSICIDGLIHCYHHAHFHQLTDKFRCFKVHLSSQFRNGNRFHHFDALGNGAYLFFSFLLLLQQLFFKEFAFLIFTRIGLFALKRFFSILFVGFKRHRA